MKTIILAAGYATRLYPLTKNQPKPLLPIANKPIIEYILDEINTVEQIDIIYVITNDKFHTHFLTWVDNYQQRHSCNKKIEIINDGTRSNESRLGSIGDINFVISEKSVDDDLFIVAGDNLLDFKLKKFITYFTEINSDAVCAYRMDSIAALRRTGVIQIDENNRIINFEEKPQQPASNIAVPAIYAFKRDTVKLFHQYLTEGNNPDAPGYFNNWLYKKKPLFAYFFEGKRYDIGDMESYQKADQLYRARL